MRSFSLSLCFLFAVLFAYSQLSYGDFSYDIGRFTQVSGHSTFVDEFDDGEVSPGGPSGPSTYSVLSQFPTDAESSGVLHLNSSDAAGGNVAIGTRLLDNTFSFISGVGGFVEWEFSFPDGITKNTFLDFGILSLPQDPDNLNESVELTIGKGLSGNITATFRSDVAGVDTDISKIDISSMLGTCTDITPRFDVSAVDVVTASLDICSDGSVDVVMPGSHTLKFLEGKQYTGGFVAVEVLGVDCAFLENPDGSIYLSIENTETVPMASEFKIWIEFTGQAISIVNIGSDGSFLLPPDFRTIIPIIPPYASLPSGLKLGSRLLDPTTGEEFCVDMVTYRKP